MSDKRSLDPAEGSISTESKRQKLDSLTEEGPLTQKDVVYFQKEAIFRQLVQYKARVGILESESREYAKGYDSYKTKVLILDGWIDQFVAYLKSLSLGELSSDADILIGGDALDINQTDGQFKENLETKKEELNSLLGGLAAKLPSDVASSLNSLSKEIGQLKISQKDLLAKNDLVQRNYQDLNTRYLEVLRQYERQSSATIQRLNATKKDDSEQNESIIESEQVPVDQSNQIEALTLEVSQQKSLIQAQEGIINDKLAKLNALQDELNIATTSQGVNSGVIKSSADYQQLYKEHELLKTQYTEHSAKYDSLLESFQNLEKKSNQLNDLFNQTFDDERGKIINQFETLEKDLVRVRTQRDELISKNAILEAEKSQPSVISDLKKQLEAQSEVLESLKTTDINPQSVDDTDVSSLQRKISILTQELQSLEKAFKSTVSSNIKKVADVLDLENNLNKYKVEKQKADQKYFAAMRSRDPLQLQLKTLKDLNKSLEAKIALLQDLKSTSQKEIDTLSSSLNTSNKLVDLKQKEIDQLSKKSTAYELKLRESGTKLDTQQTKIEQLTKENSKLSSTETSLKLTNQKLTNQNEGLTKQLTRYKSQSSEALNSEELEQYRSLIYCSLCSKNWKNTAITQCGHVFCEACTKERLDARMRKCPTCNKPFSYNDLLTVHL